MESRQNMLNIKGDLLVEFVREYKKRECLWKTDCKEYNNPYLRAIAYDEISTIFNIDANDVKRKINNLRTNLHRKLKGIDSFSDSYDTEDAILAGYGYPLWIEEMMFLKEYLKKKPQSNETTKNEPGINKDNKRNKTQNAQILKEEDAPKADEIYDENIENAKIQSKLDELENVPSVKKKSASRVVLKQSTRLFGKQLLKFIKEYRKRKCLWKMDDIGYKNSFLKAKAYSELSNIFETDVNDVKKKINSLRTSYKRKLKEIESLATDSDGCVKEEVILPFWFDEMRFINDTYVEEDINIENNISDIESNECIESVTENRPPSLKRKRELEISTVPAEEIYNHSNSSIDFDENEIEPSVDFDKKPRKMYESEKIETTSSSSSIAFEYPIDDPLGNNDFYRRKPDQLDYFCQSITSQLRGLPKKDCCELMLKFQTLITERELYNLEKLEN